APGPSWVPGTLCCIRFCQCWRRSVASPRAFGENFGLLPGGRHRSVPHPPPMGGVGGPSIGGRGPRGTPRGSEPGGQALMMRHLHLSNTLNCCPWTTCSHGSQPSTGSHWHSLL